MLKMLDSLLSCGPAGTDSQDAATDLSSEKSRAETEPCSSLDSFPISAKHLSARQKLTQIETANQNNRLHQGPAAASDCVQRSSTSRVLCEKYSTSGHPTEIQIARSSQESLPLRQTSKRQGKDEFVPAWRRKILSNIKTIKDRKTGDSIH